MSSLMTSTSSSRVPSPSLSQVEQRGPPPRRLEQPLRHGQACPPPGVSKFSCRDSGRVARARSPPDHQQCDVNHREIRRAAVWSYKFYRRIDDGVPPAEVTRPYEKLPIPTGLAIVHITLLVAHSRPNPRPDFQVNILFSTFSFVLEDGTDLDEELGALLQILISHRFEERTL